MTVIKTLGLGPWNQCSAHGRVYVAC